MSKEKGKKKTGKVLLIIGIILLIVIFLISALFWSPKRYSITTPYYGKGTESDMANVKNALGDSDTEGRFRLYFQWYNVVHELGHGLLMYNDGTPLNIVDEEQLVNDFAVAYWKYYGETDKVNELKDIANYAVIHVGNNYANGVDYYENAKKHTIQGLAFANDFFNFNDYGWFQFSSVKHSFDENKDLETVLKEMGFNDIKLNERKTLVYDKIDEDTSDKIINDAVNNFREWGLIMPDVIHHFDNDPNNSFSLPSIKYLGLFELADFITRVGRTTKNSMSLLS